MSNKLSFAPIAGQGDRYIDRERDGRNRWIEKEKERGK